KSAYGRPRRSATAREIASISRASSSSTTSSTPAARARSSTVRSSWVGPRPPETRHASASSPSRSAASSSAGASPTIEMRAGSRPCARASAARKGPFRSVRSPRTSSLPVTTTTARGRALFGAPGKDELARRRALLLLVLRPEPRHVGRRAAVPPGREDERRHEGDAPDHEEHCAPLEAPLVRPHPPSRRPGRQLVTPARQEARGVLLDVDVAVEPEVRGI